MYRNRGYKEVKSDIIAIISVIVFFVSLWNVLQMEPSTWLPIIGLCLTTAYLLPIYAEILKEEESDGDGYVHG